MECTNRQQISFLYLFLLFFVKCLGFWSKGKSFGVQSEVDFLHSPTRFPIFAFLPFFFCLGK